MSTALGSAAGTRLKGVLSRVVRTPTQGALVGAAATAIVQSSSAVAAICVGLVNSGVLTLEQAFGVILGANVGTTLTAQLVAFDLTRFAPIIMLLGSTLLLGRKRSRIGEAVFGFGSLVFGLSLIDTAVRPWLASEFVSWVLTELTSGRLQAVLAGVVTTAVIQSSSAVTSLVVVLAQAEAITLEAAVAITLGSNIGTVLTTIIASIGTIRESKATALADLMFNALGVLVVTLLMEPFLKAVTWTSDLLPRQVANAHTLFNAVTVIIALPLVPYLAALAWYWAGFIPGRKKY